MLKTDRFFEQLISQYGRLPQMDKGNSNILADYKHVRENPLCGDQVAVFLGGKDDQQRRYLSVDVQGCIICRASGKIMEECMAQTHDDEWPVCLSVTIESFNGVAHREQPEVCGSDSLKALFWLRRYPVRKKCALLPWLALEEALLLSTKEGLALE